MGQQTERAPVRPDIRSTIDMQREWSSPDVTSLGGLEDDPDWGFRWVNTSFQGNVEIMTDMHFQRVREGFTPVMAAEHPNNDAVQALKASDGHVRRPGQMLMKMSKYTLNSKKRQLEAQAFQRVNRSPAVNGSSKHLADIQTDINHAMPVHVNAKRESEVLFGGKQG